MPKPTEIKRRLPITVGERYEHIMTDMTLRATDNTTTITLYIEGDGADVVANFAAQADLVALSFPTGIKKGGAPT